ncbi:MAG: YigZ family protein [Campylobacteraceae bacterium]|nr:YigZ family protein [Campylobacteraceae bacterium]MBT3882561.1 YigZ family protein [Campylobacteraceae bacterium]MBT4179234.1 YigZ family protein [Campylobacteraceae bacterium]MBT4572478.1 YigZ family protein [Campylobacteraceae bacterium]MBT5323637.1 YigZ family protein [Campylobacteraceae bacterium]
MKFVENEFSYTLEIKRSKFITHICPYNQFNSMMKRLQEEHPKGRHFVYAYRYLNEFDQIVENSSDDGEPKGTSGKPSLSVLRGSDIINSAVIIVRYFGGIRLGTGGLVRAYGDAVNLVLENSEFKEYKKLATKTLTINYDKLGQIEYLLTQEKIIIKEKEFTSDVILTLCASKEEFESLSLQLPLGIILKD